MNLWYFIFLQESVKRKSEFAGSKEAAYKVVENMIVAFEALNREVTAAISTCQTKVSF